MINLTLFYVFLLISLIGTSGCSWIPFWAESNRSEQLIIESFIKKETNPKIPKKKQVTNSSVAVGLQF